MTQEELQTEKRDHFTFFRSFQEAIDQCQEKEQLALYKAIVNYALDGEEPTFENNLLRLAWTLIKPNLLNGWVRSRNGRKAEGVSKPGMKGNKNASKTKLNQSQNEAKTKLNQSNRIGKDRIGMDNEKENLSLSIEERKKNFALQIEQFREKFDAEMLNDFFQYWTEADENQEEMRFEAQKYFSVKARLDAWKRRNDKDNGYGK